MTFTIISLVSHETYHLDIDSLDDLQALADKYGWANLNINFALLTITIG